MPLPSLENAGCPREVAKQPQPCRLALFRMKLHAEDFSLRYHRSISRAVIRLADDHRRVIRFTVEGVDEVEERMFFYAIQQRVGARLPNLIPADLGHNQIVSKPSHPPAQQAQSGGLTELLRLFKKHLHADAHAKKRRAFSDTFTNKFIKAARRKRFHARPERSNPRQHQRFGFAQNAFIITDDRATASCGESLLDRAQIADSIIEDRYACHRSTKFLSCSALL